MALLERKRCAQIDTGHTSTRIEQPLACAPGRGTDFDHALRYFLLELDRAVAAIRAATSARDEAVARRALHSVKGLMLQFGGLDLARQATDLELADVAIMWDGAERLTRQIGETSAAIMAVAEHALPVTVKA